MRATTRLAFAFASGLVACALGIGDAQAGFLVSQGATGAQYGSSGWGDMTGYLNTATGGDITVVSSLADRDQVLAADALWIDARSGHSPGLASIERDNVTEYIATGKNVVMIGENTNWAAWNQSILEVAGGTFSGTHYLGVTPTVLSHDLTAGVHSVHLPAGGIANGGTALFDRNFATLWGPQQNVLTVLDINLFLNAILSLRDNRQFAQNTAGWFAEPTSVGSTVPEPTSLALLGLGGIGLATGAVRRRNARRA